MKRSITSCSIVILAACLAATAQTALSQTLVDSAWLSRHLKDANLMVLHVGGSQRFTKGHIAGARQITVDDVSKANPKQNAAIYASKESALMYEVADPFEIRAKLESLGISDSSRIVICQGLDITIPMMTRVAFVLYYLGIGNHFSILNGGLSGWIKAGHALSTETPPPPAKRGKITRSIVKSAIVDAEGLKKAQQAGFKIIDARAPVDFKGLQPSFGKSGHIPGALNMPSNEMNDDLQMFRKEQIEARFQEAGIKRGDKLVVYCHVGVLATEVIFAARMLGIDASLYDGSFQDWAINNRGEVEK
jgi:thiosulfate/3-mercaptopyruvate sulfurtransferase